MYRCDGQPIALAEQDEVLQSGLCILAQLPQRDEAIELSEQRHIDRTPAWIGGVALGVVVIIVRREGAHIGMRFAGDGDDARDAGDIAAGVIEKSLVAFTHRVAHEVTRLEVAYPVPGRGFTLGFSQMLDAEGPRLGFE